MAEQEPKPKAGTQAIDNIKEEISTKVEYVLNCIHSNNDLLNQFIKSADYLANIMGEQFETVKKLLDEIPIIKQCADYYKNVESYKNIDFYKIASLIILSENSLYVDAYRLLQTQNSVYEIYVRQHNLPDNKYLNIRDQAIFYFFAIHDDLKEYAPIPLPPGQQEELIGIFHRLDRYYVEHAAGSDAAPDPAAILKAFIDQENPAGETAESIAAKLPLLQGIRPASHTMPNNKLMNALQTKELINTGPYDMVVAGKRGRRTEITAYTMISFDPGETSIKISVTHLTEYERQVSDAVVSLWIEAKKRGLPTVFTPEMIFRAMPGGSEEPTPQQKGAIVKAIEKFRRLHITVDATEEMRKRRVISDKATFKIDNFYLSATHAEYKVKNGGQTVNAYRIDAEPIIYTYSNMTKQLLTVPAEFLTIRKVKNGKISTELIPMTADRQAMTGYMMRRIAIMKHAKNQSRIIKFESLFEDVGIKTTDSKQKTTDRKQLMYHRNFCFEAMDYWKARGFIQGYSREEKGRKITGIVIEL